MRDFCHHKVSSYCLRVSISVQRIYSWCSLSSSGLYLREWKERFNPDKEDFSRAPVWIRMYSLPTEYWKEETLRDICNSLGTFIKASEETKTRRYTSTAWICVQMHLTKALADSVNLFHDDFQLIQSLDYEHIPFRYRKCHEHGHLFRDSPLNLQSKPPVNDLSKDSEGFTKIPNCRRHAKKSTIAPDSSKKLDSPNRFTILTSHDPSENPPASPQLTLRLLLPLGFPNFLCHHMILILQAFPTPSHMRNWH